MFLVKSANRPNTVDLPHARSFSIFINNIDYLPPIYITKYLNKDVADT